MVKTIWLSYDLGVKGDYPTLYAWLDAHSAMECGPGLAVLKYEVAVDESPPDKLKADLQASVDFGKTGRVYVVWKNEQGLVKGRFIVGSRKSAPWQGYGNTVSEDDV